jgi:biopolymer transport protein ExbD
MNDPTQDGPEETETINVVPLADVTLVLLIVLMVLSPMISQSMIHVSTPAVKADQKIETPPDEKKPAEPLIIGLVAGGYTLNNVPVQDLSQLMAALRARIEEEPERAVLVTAEDDISVGSVVEVLDQAKQNGAKKVSLLKKAAAGGAPEDDSKPADAPGGTPS